MSHVLSRVADAPQESCVHSPPDICPVCERQPSDAAWQSCCSRHCEAGAYAALHALLVVRGGEYCGATEPTTGARCTREPRHHGNHLATGPVGQIRLVCLIGDDSHDPDDRRVAQLLAACESALPWLAIATANDALNVENAKADLLALQIAIAKAGGEPGRGMDEQARAAIAAARRDGR